MTREEAVRDIKECLEENKWGCGKYTEAFCLAKFSTIDNETERFGFCPECGADMRGNTDEKNTL